MTLLILVKNKNGTVNISDFSEVQAGRQCTWPKIQNVTRCEAQKIVKEFLEAIP